MLLNINIQWILLISPSKLSKALHSPALCLWLQGLLSEEGNATHWLPVTPLSSTSPSDPQPSFTQQWLFPLSHTPVASVMCSCLRNVQPPLEYTAQRPETRSCLSLFVCLFLLQSHMFQSINSLIFGLAVWDRLRRCDQNSIPGLELHFWLNDVRFWLLVFSPSVLVEVVVSREEQEIKGFTGTCRNLQVLCHLWRKW